MYSVHEKEVETDAESFEHVDEGDSSEELTANATMLATVATVGVVGVGVAVMEAALLPGVILGVAAVAAPKYLPKVGSAIAPIFRSAVRGVYMAGRKTRELVAEAQEQVNDIVAEIDSETQHEAEPTVHTETRKV